MATAKKNKIKKMKQKYGDQDEDEREMRLALIGGKQVKDFDIAQHQERKKQFGGKWVPGVGKIDDQADDDASDEEETQENEDQEINEDQNPQEDEKEAGEAPEQKKDGADHIAEADEDEEEEKDGMDELDENIFQNQEMGDPEDELDNEDTESMAVRQILKDEDITLVPEAQDVAEIDKLTGVPHRKDVLMFSIPMLAPYATIMNFKYKVKLTPGTQKRGRVQKNIKDLFMKTAKESKVETQHLKSIPDTDMTMSLINNCKVAAAGLQAVQ